MSKWKNVASFNADPMASAFTDAFQDIFAEAGDEQVDQDRIRELVESAPEIAKAYLGFDLEGAHFIAAVIGSGKSENKGVAVNPNAIGEISDACDLSEAELAEAQAVIKELRGNDSKGKKSGRPSPWVRKRMGASQLPPGALRWILTKQYGFKNSKDVDAAMYLVACEIVRQRFVFLPDTAEVFRVTDRKIVTKANAVSEARKWFKGMETKPTNILSMIETECEQAEGIVRLPGRDARFRLEGRFVVNRWTPPPWPEFKVTDTDVAPYLEAVRYIYGAEADLRLNWETWQIHPATRSTHLRWGWVVISDAHQAGKEATANIFSRALGIQNRTNGRLGELSEDGAETAAFLTRGSFIVFSESKITYDKLEVLKAVSGSEKFLVRMMYRNGEYIDHAATFQIVSNDTAVVAIDAKNERFMIVHHTAARMPDAWYDNLRAWEADNGAAKLFNWHRQRGLAGALKDFNYQTRPYETQAEAELIDTVASPAVTDLRDMIVAGEGPFGAELIELDVARREIAEGVNLPGGRRYEKEVTKYDLQRALKAAGAKALRGRVSREIGIGKDRKVVDREKVSFWALRNCEQWEALDGPGAPEIRGLGFAGADFERAKGTVRDKVVNLVQPA